MSIKAIKLSATQVRLLPLPSPSAAWDQAATRFRDAQNSPEDRARHLRHCGRHMCEAYGLDEATTTRLMAWWVAAAKL